MKIVPHLTIPRAEIESVRWKASLPAKKINRFTLRIYRATANMKAMEKAKRKPVDPMKQLAAIMEEAAGDIAVFKQIINAYDTVEPIPTKRKDIGSIINSPAEGIRNKPGRKVLLDFVETVDFLQGRLGRTPTRNEIIKAIGNPSFGENECRRQVKAAGWEEWI